MINDPFGIGFDIGSTVLSSYESVPFDNNRRQSSRTSSSTPQISKGDEAIYKQILAGKESCLLLIELLDNAPQGRELKNNEVINEVLSECKSIRKSFLRMIKKRNLQRI